MKEIFLCEHCQKEFEKGWSDKKAKEEFELNFTKFERENTTDLATMCDDCYEEFMIWFNALQPDKIKEYKDERT